MEGARRREERCYELATFEAWQIARLIPVANANKLRRLDHYLGELKPKKPEQIARETFSFVRQLKAEAAADGAEGRQDEDREG
jgi:hypothetical protein